MKKNKMISAVFTIRFSNRKSARAVDVALSPDNVKLPQGMKISQTLNGNELRVKISVDSLEKLSTLIGTLDEFLSHVQVATKTLEGIQR